ncbi:L-threonylcarbamoyladenylate synthase [Vampirovibrio chlorellavorus]|uniref:L-threonylcarbamoyladenylate synthase n=1 Tax=Vampirovibrio chlorellavorus TaxID=758823 RepID=UPI0026EC998B|nr:L-threonylcarbamoyladenylate synthase [Vampirovibrio chlorellavorus]
MSPAPTQLIDSSQPELKSAAQCLKAGGLVAFPTETVYGLGADAENPEALAKLYAVKGRPTHHPVIVHVASAQQLAQWAVDIPEGAQVLAEAFWPGPLTLILKRSSRVPDAVTGGQDTVGIRVPDHPVALALLQTFGGGVAAPSANRFGRLSPTTAQHVQQDLGEDVDVILDGGPCQVGVESTIVAFREGRPVILRPGLITEDQIQQALQAASRGFEPQSGILANAPTSTVSRAPGTLASHYAPRTPLRLFSPSELPVPLADLQPQDRIGVLAVSEAVVLAFPAGSVEKWVEMPNKPEDYARLLYATLRDLDALGLSCIWVERVPADAPWAAVVDRLTRAAFVG